MKIIKKVLPLISAATLLICMPAYADDNEKKDKGFLGLNNLFFKGVISGVFQPILIDGNYYLFYEFREKARDAFLKTLSVKTFYPNGGYWDLKVNNLWWPDCNFELSIVHSSIYKLDSSIKWSEFYPLTFFALAEKKDITRDKGQRVQANVNGEFSFFEPFVLSGGFNLIQEQKDIKLLKTDASTWNNMNSDLSASLYTGAFAFELNSSVTQFKNNRESTQAPWVKTGDQYKLGLNAGYSITPGTYANAEYSLTGQSSSQNRTNTINKAKFNMKSALLPNLALKANYQLQGKDSQIKNFNTTSKYAKLAESYTTLSNKINFDLIYSGLPKTYLKAGAEWQNLNRNTQGNFNVLGSHIDAQTTVLPYSKLSLQYNNNYNLFDNWSWHVSSTEFSNKPYFLDMANLKLQAQILPQLPVGVIGSYNFGNQANIDNNINLTHHTFGALVWLQLFDSLNLSYDFNYRLNQPSYNLTGFKVSATNDLIKWYISNYATHSVTFDYTLNEKFNFGLFYSWLSTENAVQLNENRAGIRANYKHGQGSEVSIGYAIDSYDDKSFENDNTLKYLAHIITLNLKHNF